MATRTCISCRSQAERGDLVRLVVAPDGVPAVDFSQRLPGRGAYACWQRACLAGAARGGTLSRTLRRDVQEAPEDWAIDRSRAYLRRRLAEICGLARRSGVLKSGAHTVEMSFRRGWVHAGLVTQDAATDSADRVRRRCERADLPLYELPLTSEEFGRAVGKGIRSVAVVSGGALKRELERTLQRYRGLL